MADKTIGFKISEELHDRVKTIIDGSGMASKDWFEKAVALTEMQSIKDGASEYRQDLNELEIHTTRMYEIVANMVQRAIYVKDHAVNEVKDKLERTEATISEYQDKAKKALEDLEAANQLLEEAGEEKELVLKQMNELRTTNENNQLLIRELKEKNDSMIEFVEQQKAFAEDFNNTKKEYAENVARLESANKEYKAYVAQLDEQIKDLKHSLVQTVDNMNFEKDKALLELERQYQQKLLEAEMNRYPVRTGRVRKGVSKK